MIILISALSLVNFPPDIQAQPLLPLTFTIKENDPVKSAAEIYAELLNEKQVIYSGFESDLQNLLQTLINSIPLCSSSSPTSCPNEPSVFLNSFSGGSYNFELRGLVIGDTSVGNNVQSAYIRYDTPPMPGSPNYSIIQSAFNNNLFNITHSSSANTVIFVSIIQPNGRSKIKAIIIADKYIL